ncbi:kinase family protein [Stylonychia lemnae]|uniref:Kinase family protein n=1 Tax=Stylonychia lemnae TaxID=5949 RepID=A0A078AFT2_STYLE|nr:kinase family protein [Stylonychia lemnae]|eukprot:CDW80352.1 kinase family protein [Stylonychia lemnae]
MQNTFDYEVSAHLQQYLQEQGLLDNHLIGVGKFSKVFKIEVGGKFYAMKQLKREVGSFSHLDNILNEVMILSKIQHPNITKLIGKYRNKEFYNIVLEYCNGGDLKNYLKQNGVLPEITARKLMKQLLRSLQYLHEEKHIVHRDVKSQNIMLEMKNTNGQSLTEKELVADLRIQHSQQQLKLKVKLCDFGFSRILQPFECMIQSYGTPIYMAPEVITSQPYDFKSDIWSAGITFFEMLSGSFPFNGSNKSEIYSKIKTGKYQFDKSLNISMLCLDFLSHCLQFNPDRRFSASQLLDHPYLRYSWKQLQQMAKVGNQSKSKILSESQQKTIIKTQDSSCISNIKNNDQLELLQDLGAFGQTKMLSFQNLIIKELNSRNFGHDQIKNRDRDDKYKTQLGNIDQYVLTMKNMKQLTNPEDKQSNLSFGQSLNKQKREVKRNPREQSERSSRFQNYKNLKNPMSKLNIDIMQQSEVNDPETSYSQQKDRKKSRDYSNQTTQNNTFNSQKRSISNEDEQFKNKCNLDVDADVGEVFDSQSDFHLNMEKLDASFQKKVPFMPTIKQLQHLDKTRLPF